MKTTDKRDNPLNWLDLIPEPTVKWVKNDDGLVVLLKPKFNHPFFKKHIIPRMKRPEFKIKLDEIGSFIMENCDGKRTVRDLGDRMKDRFGEKVEPLYDRLTQFFQQLERNRFIQYLNLKKPE